MRQRKFFLSALLTVAFLVLPIMVFAQKVVDEKQAVDKVAIRGVSVKDHVISGEVMNRSLNVIRNVEMLFQYHWLWKNETHPGENPPGRAVYITLDKELRPGESMS